MCEVFTKRSWTGKLLRVPLKLLPPSLIVPILQGRIKGKKWIVGSGSHGFWLGSYERKQRRVFEKTIAEDSVVFDIGANVGYYTLLASALVGHSGKVFAFEPLSQNVEYLKRHMDLNACHNVTVMEAAVSNVTGITNFMKGSDSGRGRLASCGSIQVTTVALDEWFAQCEIPLPDYLKIDVEGEESKVLEGAEGLIDSGRPVIFLSTHGKAEDEMCVDFLAQFGYVFEEINEYPQERGRELLTYVR